MTIAWTPVPEPQSWPLAKPMMHGGIHYATVTLGAPTSEDVLKATAVSGASGLDVTLRMIESASAEHVPYDVLKKQPHWLNQQIADYMEEFVGAPAPDPLESWRRARRDAQVAEIVARAEAEAKAAEQARALTAAAAAAPAS
jgi:hypothetical protein